MHIISKIRHYIPSKAHFICTVSVCLFLVSCNFKDKVEFGSISNFKINSYSDSLLYCNAQIEIKNNNLVSFKINSGELTLLVNEKPLGTAHLLEPVKVARNKSDIYALTFSVSLKNNTGGVLSMISSFFGKKPTLELRGNMNIKYLIFTTDVAVRKALTNK